jgi:hypothetical protein
MRIQIKQDSKGSFLDFMKDFEKQLVELPLRGIANIKQVELSESNIIKYNNDGTLEPCKEWMLGTNGSNLLDILSEDAVDSTRTITNDIWEFHDTFGIEATRELIYHELCKVYEGKSINPRHVQIMSDIMTYRGKLMQIDRHGLNKNSEIGPIAKASFEEVMNIFTKAALFAEKDNMKGVSSSILAGQFCKVGTNCFDIVMDEDLLLEDVTVPNYTESDYINVNETDVDIAFSTAYPPKEEYQNVTDDDFTFGFGIEQEKEFKLDTITTSNVKIENKPKAKNNVNEINYEQITVEEPVYKNDNELNENNGLNINFDKINIEEPTYVEEEPKKPTKLKKVRVSKKKNDKIEEK